MMHQNILHFLRGTVLVDLPDLAATKPYLGAAILAGGIEFLGACLDPYPLVEEDTRRSSARFCLALNELFPSAYHAHSRVAPYSKAQKPTHDLYSSLRCGMAHILRPAGVALTTSIEAAEDGNSHLSIVTRDGQDLLVVVVDEFIGHYKGATKTLINRLETEPPLPDKLQGAFLHVWER
jgi:hypothetical protein